jgi:tetratricopeptide (TPR) repeat protein
VGDRFYLANALNNLANVTRAQGDYAAARALYHESLTINRGLGDKWALAYLLEDIGCLHALEGRAVVALRLVGAASAVREAIGAPRSGAEEAKLQQALAPARQSLDEATQAAAASAGMALPLEEAIDEALSG